MTIGEKIRRVRKSRGMTLADVANRLGMTAAGLSLIERNERRVSVNTLTAIAEALSVDVGVFFAPELDAASSACADRPDSATA